MGVNMAQSETSFEIGEDLYGVSVEELKERIQLLKSEIDRIERELTKKQSDMSIAEQFFKKSD